MTSTSNVYLYPGEPNPYDVKLRHGGRYIVRLFIEVLGASDSKTRQKSLYRLYTEVIDTKNIVSIIKRWAHRRFLEHPRQKVS